MVFQPLLFPKHKEIKKKTDSLTLTMTTDSDTDTFGFFTHLRKGIRGNQNNIINSSFIEFPFENVL